MRHSGTENFVIPKNVKGETLMLFNRWTNCHISQKLLPSSASHFFVVFSFFLFLVEKRGNVVTFI